VRVLLEGDGSRTASGRLRGRYETARARHSNGATMGFGANNEPGGDCRTVSQAADDVRQPAAMLAGGSDHSCPEAAGRPRFTHRAGASLRAVQQTPDELTAKFDLRHILDWGRRKRCPDLLSRLFRIRYVKILR
jgi:hypothetical protein